jgi:integrase
MTKSVKITKRAVDALKAGPARYVVWDTEIAGFGVRVSTSGLKSYVLKYRVGGGRSGRVRWALIGQHGSLTPDQARDIVRRWAAEVAGGGDPAGIKEDRRNAPTVAALMERYLKDHVSKKNKPTTEREAGRLVEKVIGPALGKLKVADVTRADIDRLHSSLSDTPYQANRALAALSKAFALSELWGMRPDGSNPAVNVERFEEKRRERFLSPQEFAALGEVMARAEHEPLTITGANGKPRKVRVNPEALRAIRLAIFTGMRMGEVLALRWEYLDVPGQRANLPDSKTGRKTVQLPAPAQEILAGADMPATGRGFVIRGGDASDPETPLVNYKSAWSAVRAAAGLPDVRPHDLRHAFASVAVAGNMSLVMVGKLLGHADVKTTQRYAHLANDPQQAAAAVVAGRISDAMKGPQGGAEIVPFHKKA